MDARTVSFIVPGDPVAQPRPRFTAARGFPQAYTPKGHPVTAYRQAVALMARAAGAVADHDDDVELEIVAIFARPASHWTRAGLKPKAPTRPRKSDWDNVGKAVCDALNGVAWRDDDQIVDGRVRRRYASRNESARTVVTIRRL